ncbi:MAG: hypothetical protein OS112_01720 [Methanoregula sp.]|nr:MAG: hypothetical protein OS112_01720 [Methanoregula sp.]
MRLPVCVLLLVLLLAISGGCVKHIPETSRNGTLPENTAGPVVSGPTSLPAAGDRIFTLQHNGLKRSFLVHIPLSYTGSEPVPVVIVFHGGGDDIYGMMRQSGITATSDSEGFIAVFPQGIGKTIGGKTTGTWNAGRCCGSAETNNVDDVGFISALLDDMELRFSIDKDRVYATGISNGALFSYRLACELSGRIAAIAPVAGQDAFDNCHPSRPVPVIHFHGTTDPAALYKGGHCGGRLPGDPGWNCVSVPEYIGRWVTSNSCSPESVESFRNGSAICRTYGHCPGGADVTLCTIGDGGHTWPGGEYLKDERWWKEAVGNISRDISANDLMWEFFKSHPKK